MARLPRSAVILVGLTLAGACARRQPPPPPQPTVNQDSINAEQARRDSIARAEAARQDSISRAQQEAERQRAEREAAVAAARSALTAPVYFAYDSDALSDTAQATLDQKLAVINANPSVRIRIAGNTDARGSAEYNLALGQRRAASVKRYLTQRGVSADRIETVSYGEERPAAQGTDESAYAQNRRAEFEILAGGDALTPPPGQ